MIRKTFICVAGILAGATTGAYFDGFFEQENVVTNAYQQVTSKFNSPGVANVDGEGSAIDAQNLNTGSTTISSSNATTPVSATTPAAEHSSMADDATHAAVRTANSKNADAMNPTSATDVSQAKKKGNKAVAAESKAEAMKNAKSMALLDLRFSKETFKSPSGGELKYRKLTPRTVGSSRPLPLILFLHGKGERGDDNVSQLKHGLEYFASREGMQKFPATIIAPQCPNDSRWSTTLAELPTEGDFDPTPTDAMKMTMELVDSIQITDNIDPSRIYVTGLSMGGFGTFDIIARRPSTFAAAVPLCGGGDTKPEVVNLFKKTPLWIIHGNSDKVVQVEKSRSMVMALKEAGGSPRYSELDGFGHNIWDAAYDDKELYKWLFNQSKAGEINASNSNQVSGIAKSPATTKSGSGTTSAADANTNIAERSQASSKSSGSLKEAIQSDWQVLAATRRGRRADPATLEKMQVKFKDDSMTIAIGDRSEAAKFNLPTAKNSPYSWIDMISQRDGIKDSAGILAMQGDKLVICWGLPGEDRPTTFDSKEGVKTLVLQKK